MGHAGAAGQGAALGADAPGHDAGLVTTGSRDDLAALLRLVQIDDDAVRMRGALGEIVARIDGERADLAAAADLVVVDLAAGGYVPSAGQRWARRRERTDRVQEEYAARASAFESHEREALSLSAEIQRRMVEAEERRQALETSVSGVVLARYEAAKRVGVRPVLVPEVQGHCPACGRPLGSLQRFATSEGRVVGCTGCPRLLYGHAGLSRGAPRPSLRPAASRRR